MLKKGQLNLFYYTAIAGKKVIYHYHNNGHTFCWETYTNFTVGHHYDKNNKLITSSRSFNFYRA